MFFSQLASQLMLIIQKNSPHIQVCFAVASCFSHNAATPYLRKKPNRKGGRGGVQICNFQRGTQFKLLVQRNIACIPHLFPGVGKKKRSGISPKQGQGYPRKNNIFRGVGFWPWNFPGMQLKFSEFPGVELCFVRNFQGQVAS